VPYPHRPDRQGITKVTKRN